MSPSLLQKIDCCCQNSLLLFCRLSILSEKNVTSFSGHVTCRFHPLEGLIIVLFLAERIIVFAENENMGFLGSISVEFQGLPQFFLERSLEEIYQKCFVHRHKVTKIFPHHSLPKNNKCKNCNLFVNYSSMILNMVVPYNQAIKMPYTFVKLIQQQPHLRDLSPQGHLLVTDHCPEHTLPLLSVSRSRGGAGGQWIIVCFREAAHVPLPAMSQH